MPDSETLTRPLTSDTIETLANRVSVRAFTDEPVTDEQVDAIADIGKALESDRSRASTTVRRGNGTHSAMISAGH